MELNTENHRETPKEFIHTIITKLNLLEFL